MAIHVIREARRCRQCDEPTCREYLRDYLERKELL